jgi:hypothetical protein
MHDIYSPEEKSCAFLLKQICYSFLPRHLIDSACINQSNRKSERREREIDPACSSTAWNQLWEAAPEKEASGKLEALVLFAHIPHIRP